MRRAGGWLTLAALLILASVVVATFPAAVAWRWWGKELPELTLNGVEGTVWHGSSGRASVRGQALGKLEWNLSPLSLLRGEPAVELAIEGAGLKLSGAFATDERRRIRIERLKVDADAAWLAPALAIPALEPTGRIVAEGASALLGADGVPEALDARLEWQQAGVRGTVVARLGTLVIEAHGRDGRILATIADQGDGELEVRGSASIEGGSYRSETVLVPRSAQGPVVEALQWVGEARPEGGRRLLIEGRILATEVAL